jgi:hypothetical protein
MTVVSVFTPMQAEPQTAPGGGGPAAGAWGGWGALGRLGATLQASVNTAIKDVSDLGDSFQKVGQFAGCRAGWLRPHSLPLAPLRFK